MKGDLLYAKGEPIEDVDSMQAEAITFLHVAKYYKQTQNSKVIIQIDSLIMKQILIEEWKCLWNITTIVRQKN